MENRAQKGLILKQARETKGIGLEAVHEATKIPMDALRAIEEGYTVRTLSPFYYRGFLKIYARYLGVNPSEVVDDFQEEKLPQRAVKKTEEKKPKRLAPLVTPQTKALIIKVLLAVFVLLFFIKGVSLLVHRKPRLMVQSATQAARLHEKKELAKAKPVVVSEKKKSPENALAPTPLAAVPSESKKDLSPPAPAPQKIDLAVRAQKDTWLQVKVDGGIVFQSTLKKGAVEIWHANNTIELSGKDISALDLERNGKIIGPLGHENRKAKKVIIDLNGFSVK